MWSPFTAHSRPDVVRTAETFLADAEAYLEAKESNPEVDPILFNNTVHRPTKFIVAASSFRDLLDAIPPAMLHLLLNAVKRFLTHMRTMSPITSDEFMLMSRLQHSQHRGADGFALVGNDCRIALQFAKKLMSCPSLQKPRRALRSESTDNQSSTYLVTPEVQHAMLLLKKAMLTFDVAYRTPTKRR